LVTKYKQNERRWKVLDGEIFIVAAELSYFGPFNGQYKAETVKNFEEESTHE
jgi:hypothetical protein